MRLVALILNINARSLILMRFIALLPLLALTACGAGGSNITEVIVDRAPTQTVRVAGVPQPVQLGGFMDTGRRTVFAGTVPRHEIVITLNGQEAIRQVVNTYRDTDVSGNWQGRPVTANCRYSNDFDSNHRASRQFACTVAVAQQQAGTLTFSAYGRGRRPQQTAALN